MTIMWVIACLWAVQAKAQPAFVPPGEAVAPPTPARLAAVQSAAKRDGWMPQAAGLGAAATLAYERDQLPAAEAWLNLHRWARLWGQSERDYLPKWVAAVAEAKVGHRGMITPTPRAQPLGAALAPELQAWILGSAAFSAEFFSLLTPVDCVPRVFDILQEIHRRDSARFRTHASLALAIALVHDVPPPPVWPHAQVTLEALPRVFPSPADVFTWWIKQEQNGRLYHKLSRLGADELKFVVDTVAPFTELEWAQQASHQSLSQLAGAYAMIRYRSDRVMKGEMIWPGRVYALREILAQGGICTDQAYFATQVGKARGVPTLLIYGAGNDGRHAWFGFLDGNRKWQLDAGRYAEQRFVTGLARDPQTWREFSDHELQFMTERFRDLPSFRQSQVHASFAAEFLLQDKPRPAAVAARRAIDLERRNQPAWETLLAAAKREAVDAKRIEALLREAASAFQRYPDLELGFVNRLAESLRARGETNAAEAEIRRVVLKNKGGRGDINVQQAREMVRRAMSTQPLPEQLRTFNMVLDTHGRGAGMSFFDEVVVGFVEHLLGLGQRVEAARALDRARQTLRVEPRSQLAQEIDQLAKMVKGESATR